MKSFQYLIVFSLIFFFGFSPADTTHTSVDQITWYSMQKAQKLARKNHRKVLVFAGATWCEYCKKMEREVFPDQAVIDSMKAYYYPVKIEVDSGKKIVFNGKTMTTRQFGQQFQVRALPTTFFMNADGKVLGAQPGYIPSKMFSQLLAFVGSGAFNKMKFESYLKQHSSGKKSKKSD